LKPVGASSGWSVALSAGAAWDSFAGLSASASTDGASIKAILQMPRAAHASFMTVLGNIRRIKVRLDMVTPPQSSFGHAQKQSVLPRHYSRYAGPWHFPAQESLSNETGYVSSARSSWTPQSPGHQ